MVSVRKAEERQNRKLSHLPPLWPLLLFFAVVVMLYWWLG